MCVWYHRDSLWARRPPYGKLRILNPKVHTRQAHIPARYPCPRPRYLPRRARHKSAHRKVSPKNSAPYSPYFQKSACAPPPKSPDTPNLLEQTSRKPFPPVCPSAEQYSNIRSLLLLLYATDFRKICLWRQKFLH